MNRYIMFVGSYYYPDGGWDDFYSSFEAFEKAHECILIQDKYQTPSIDDLLYKGCDWIHIIDAESGQFLWRLSDSDMDVARQECFVKRQGKEETDD